MGTDRDKEKMRVKITVSWARGAAGIFDCWSWLLDLSVMTVWCVEYYYIRACMRNETYYSDPRIHSATQMSLAKALGEISCR